MLNKTLIKNNFFKNLDNYNKYGSLQKTIAQELMEELLKIDNKFNNILEIGCGTGFLTDRIIAKIKYKKLYLNDLNNIASIFAKLKHKFLMGDIEKISIPEELDLVISSSVFQWLSEFELLVKKVNESLNDKGYFVFSMFTEGNLQEIKDIFNVSLNYLSPKEIIQILSKDFSIVYASSFQKKLYFINAIEVLKHLKNTGVNSIEKNIINRKSLKLFDKYKIDNDIALSYCYSFFIVKKL